MKKPSLFLLIVFVSNFITALAFTQADINEVAAERYGQSFSQQLTLNSAVSQNLINLVEQINSESNDDFEQDLHLAHSTSLIAKSNAIVPLSFLNDSSSATKYLYYIARAPPHFID